MNTFRPFVYIICFFLAFAASSWSTELFGQDDVRRKGRKLPAQPQQQKPRTEPTRPTTTQPAQPQVNPATAAPIVGRVRDAQTKEPLVGVYIQVEGTVSGAISDEDGNFKISRANLPEPATLVFSYIGYAKQSIEVTINDKTVEIKLEEEALTTDEVVVTASRVSERIVESPVSIEKLDLRSLSELPTLSIYDAVATMKGVDQMVSSFSFKAINTRGFNSPANVRFVQRLDGVDLQAPGLNFPIGALNGAGDLDAASIELIPGAASALYGPNAFNGMMEVTSKSPFQYPGLSAFYRQGVNHVDGIDSDPQPIYDFGVRYGHVFSDKLAAKVNFNYTRGREWYATDLTDASQYQGTFNEQRFGRGAGNPGFDALNRYGDEVTNRFTPGQALAPGVTLWPESLQPLLVARTGYDEQYLVNYESYNAKTDVAVHYKISPKVELIWNSRLAMGTTVYQDEARNSLTNFTHQVHRLEAKGDNFTVRAYASMEDAGDSYDSRFMGINMNNRAKAHEAWFAQYMAVYSPTLNPLLNSILTVAGRDTLSSLNDAQARAFADGDNRALQPLIVGGLRGQGFDEQTATAIANSLTAGQARFVEGSKEFNEQKELIAKEADRSSGAGFVDRTKFYHIEGQYDLKKFISWADVIVGANYRYYDLVSEGTVFSDTSGRKLSLWEIGAYAQATKRFMDNKLRVSLSGRMDKNTNFDAQFSPRLAVVYTPDEARNHNFRTSVQTGFRMPTLQNQYINLPIGALMFIGGLDEFLGPNNLLLEGSDVRNAYTETSVLNYASTGDPNVLERATIRPIRPENVQSIEVGYKTKVKSKLLFDVSYYVSRYRNFLLQEAFVGPRMNSPGADSSATLSLADLQSGNFTPFRRIGNSDKDVWSQGATFGFQYGISGKYNITGNYTYAELLSTNLNDGGFIVGFNTPKHKTVLTLTGRDLWKNFGFGITHRWIDAIIYESSVFTGPIAAYNLVDAQISYQMPKKYHTQLRLGGTNVLNNRHLEARFGPTVGAIYYIEIRYDDLLK